MTRLLKEPFFHFVVLGALIFAVHGLLNRQEDPEPRRIVVSLGKIDNLRATFSRVWQRPPSPDELDGLIQDHVREEVLSREAMALGLDRDDTVIRRRLRQKMEFVANDIVAPSDPTEGELEQFLANHPDLFRVEPRFTLRQVYLNPDRRGDAVTEDAVALLAKLNLAGAGADFKTMGDGTLLRPEWVDVSPTDVARQFGEEFTRQVVEVPESRWHGPVTSGYGLHLVWVENRVPGRVPELASVREKVAMEWEDEQRRIGNEQFYEELLGRYTISVELPLPPGETNALSATN